MTYIVTNLLAISASSLVLPSEADSFIISLELHLIPTPQIMTGLQKFYYLGFKTIAV